jgi:hypothetical protein
MPESGLTVEVVDPDEDYLGIELRASNARFSGSTWIYAALDEFSRFAAEIEGFPRHYADQRAYEFGSRDPSVAGGYCGIAFRCLDRAGHVGVDVVLADDEGRHEPASARLSFQTEAAAIDCFLADLLTMERERRGSAALRRET